MNNILLYENLLTGNLKERIENAIRNNANIIVTGKTGSGKSSFMLYLWKILNNKEKLGYFSYKPESDVAINLKNASDMVFNDKVDFYDTINDTSNNIGKYLFYDEFRISKDLMNISLSYEKGYSLIFSVFAEDIRDIKSRFDSCVKNNAVLKNNFHNLFLNSLIIQCDYDMKTGKHSINIIK